MLALLFVMKHSSEVGTIAELCTLFSCKINNLDCMINMHGFHSSGYLSQKVRSKRVEPVLSVHVNNSKPSQLLSLNIVHIKLWVLFILPTGVF